MKKKRDWFTKHHTKWYANWYVIILVIILISAMLAIPVTNEITDYIKPISDKDRVLDITLTYPTKPTTRCLGGYIFYRNYGPAIKDGRFVECTEVKDDTSK